MPNYELFVERILNDLRITNYEDLFFLKQIAFARKANVFEDDLESCEARLIFGKNFSYITIRKDAQERRKRFSIAHELGHLEMHRGKFNSFSCKDEEIDNWFMDGTYGNLEIEANEFASALLLPERFFKSDCEVDPSMEIIIQLANKFNTSVTATSRRFVKYCPLPSAIVWSEGGWIKWFSANLEFLELGLFVDVKGKVVYGTSAWNIFNGKANLSKPQKSEISDWMKSGCETEFDLYEQSVDMSNYNGVLTLLWLEDNTDPFDYDD